MPRSSAGFFDATLLLLLLLLAAWRRGRQELGSPAVPSLLALALAGCHDPALARIDRLEAEIAGIRSQIEAQTHQVGLINVSSVGWDVWLIAAIAGGLAYLLLLRPARLWLAKRIGRS